MSIRIRLAALFAVATLAFMTVGGVVFVVSLRDGLRGSLDSSLRSQADTLAQSVKDTPGSVQPRDARRAALHLPSNVVAQVIDPGGHVVEASDEVGRTPLVPRAILEQARHARTFTTIYVDDDPYRAVAMSVRIGTGTWRVVIGSSLDPNHAAVSRVITEFLVGGSIAVILAALGAWILATFALRPVERIRRAAAHISGHDSDAQLPVPSTRDEIAALATTMNELLARLQGALARERAFVADAGHELRTPLAVLRTELELAERPARSRDELIDAIRNAALETDRLARLAEELLFLARAEDRPTSGFDVEPIVPLLRQSVQAFTRRAEERAVSVRIVADPGLAAPLDAISVRRAVDNLIDNALRYAPGGSEIVIEAREDGGSLIVEVRDTGAGFPDGFLPHAFERFRRADSARARVDGGSGLGLAIVSAVARRHGGTAQARNRETGGAAVTLRLPTIRPEFAVPPGGAGRRR